MAIKFFKVLGGLSKLFNKSNKKDDFSNLTTAASNKGINENSIVHVTATSDDTGSFGARYLPDTSVLYVNGQPHIDSKNILFGISMQVYSNIPVFIAPKGLLKATDTVKVARIRKTNASGKNSHGADSIGLTIPDQDLGITLKKYAGDTVESSNMEKWAFCVSTSYLNISELSLLLNTQSKAGAILTDSKIAFSIWRNQVQVSDWFQWYFDGSQLKVEKGLYLPGVQEIKYEDLLAKAKSEKLVPGRRYCITDYCPTSVRSDLVNAGVQNKGLYLTALTKNTLSEDGILVYGDQQCEVKYGITKNRWSSNDISTDTNYTGEVYWMRDPYNNEATYDFKGYKLKDGNTTYWTFNADDESDGSSNGECTNNRILYDGYYNILSPGIHNLVLNVKRGDQIIHQTNDQYSNQIVAKGYQTPSGTSSQFLMADGSTLNGIDATATKLDASADPTVNFNNSTFNFGIPSGQDGSKWYSGTAITGTNTTGTKFTSSGITAALARDKYLNTSNSNIYECVTGGNASTATWKYIGNIKGAKGDTGAKGDKGDTGAKGDTGVGITKIEDSGETGSGAERTITVTLTDGNTQTFTVYNGAKGEQGDKGDKGDTGSVANIEDGTSGEVVTGLTLSNGTITMNKGSVGGRNLLKENKWRNATKTSDSYLGNPVYSCTYPTSNAPSNGLFDITYSDDLNGKFANGEYVTVSFYAKSSTNITDSKGEKIVHHFYNIKQTTTGGLTSRTTSSWGYSNSNIADGLAYNISLTTTWKKYSITWKLDDQNAEKDNITISLKLFRLKEVTKGTTIYFSNVKLEKGSIPTDWSVAPEEGDLYNNSAHPTITVGGIGPDTNLQNKTMKEMFDLLLYPVVAFKDLYVQVSPSSFEYNTKPNSITYTAKFTAGSKDVSYIWDNDKTKTSNSITITPTAKLTSGPRHSVTVSDTSAGGTTTLSASGAPGITYRWFFGLGTETTPALGTVGSLGTSVTKRDYSLQGDTTNYKVWLLYPNITGWTMPTILNMGAPFNDYAEINGVTYNGLSYKAFKFNPEYKAGETKFTLQ